MSDQPSTFTDTFVRSSTPVVNYGSDEALEVRKIGTEERLSFLHFDVPPKPGYQIASVTLYLYCYNITDPATGTALYLAAYMVGSPWTAPTLVYNEQPSIQGSPLSQAGVTAVGWVGFDITTAYAAWFSGDFNYGVRISSFGNDDSQAYYFRSSESSTTAERPYVDVTYTVRPPQAPLASQDNFPATEARSFTWTFRHDDPNAAQTAYQVEIMRVSDSVVVHDSTKVTSSTASHLLAAGTLVDGVDYQWRVKTWTTNDTAGSFSDYDTFRCQSRPTVAITAPTASQVITTVAVEVAWSYSHAEAQDAYRVQLFNNVTDALVETSGIVTSALQAHTFQVLTDGDYRAEVEAFNASDVANVAVDVVFSVDTVPPPTPTIVVTPSSDEGLIEIAITNPATGVGEQDAVDNEVARRLVGASAWTTLESDLALNATYEDPTPSSGATYEYRVRTFSAEGTFADATAQGSVSFYGLWLMQPDDASTLRQYLYDGLGRSESWEPEMSLFHFNGRSLPVVEFGQQTFGAGVGATIQVPSGTTDRADLLRVSDDRVLLRYRDSQGRNFLGVISSLTIDDTPYGGRAQLRIDAVDAS